jgi:hypothetical protein
LMLLFAVPIFAQISVTGRVHGGPSTSKPAACSNGDQYNATNTAAVYICQQNVWVPLGAVNPTRSNAQLQRNNGGTAEASQDIKPDGHNLNVKSPAPWFDIGAQGARGLNGPFQSTVICSNGNPQVTTGSSGYLTGEGVTLQGCGPNITMSTPSAPTVTPQYANAPQRDHLLSNSPTGSSTYIYAVVAEDRAQGLTPVSSTRTITNGPASLGKQTAKITSASLSNDTLTVRTSSGTFVGGMMVDVSSIHRFTGPMRTNSGTKNSFTVAPYVDDSRVTPSNVVDAPNSSSASGTVTYYQANTITWTAVTGARRYWICAERPGDSALHVIGQSDMSYARTGWQGAQFEDWGSSFLAGQSWPYYITDAICTGSGQADSLTTTVASGGGTTRPTLAAAPSNNTSGTKINHDDGPALLAAANQAANGVGCVYIPATSSPLVTFRISSLTLLPTGVCVIQDGGLDLDDTLELNSVYWMGWNQENTPQFAFTHGSFVREDAANPGFHLVGTGNYIAHVSTQARNNAATMFTQDNGNSVLDAVNCFTDAPSHNDTLGVCTQYRQTFGGVSLDYIKGGSSFISGFSGGIDGTWAQLIDINGGANLTIEKFSGDIRNISYGGSGLTLDHYYTQGPITPIVTVWGQGGGNNPIYLGDVIGDTTGEPIVGNLTSSTNLTLTGTYGFASLINPVISGNRPNKLNLQSYASTGVGSFPNRGTQSCQALKVVTGVYEAAGAVSKTQQVCFMSNLFEMLGAYPLIAAPLPAPATPTLSGPSAGGSIPSGTFEYAVAANGFDGGWTMPSPIPSSTITTSGTCPGSGNCTVTVNWVAVSGAVSYNIWRCASTCDPAAVGFVNGNNWLLVG